MRKTLLSLLFWRGPQAPALTLIRDPATLGDEWDRGCSGVPRDLGTHLFGQLNLFRRVVFEAGSASDTSREKKKLTDRAEARLKIHPRFRRQAERPESDTPVTWDAKSFR